MEVRGQNKHHFVERIELATSLPGREIRTWSIHSCSGLHCSGQKTVQRHGKWRAACLGRFDHGGSYMVHCSEFICASVYICPSVSLWTLLVRRLIFRDFMQLTLSLSGATTFGHDFEAITDANSPFVKEYNSVMEGIASPPYLFSQLRSVTRLIYLFLGISSSRSWKCGSPATL